jgi:hypothetical protein
MSHLTVRRSLALGLAALFFGTAPALAAPDVGAAQAAPPSLAEIARKEAERRKTTKEAKKVITAKDLPESARKPASTPASSDGSAPATPAATASTGQKPAEGADAASSDGKGETAWRSRITKAREELRRNETFFLAMQTRVNSLTNDAQSRSDPIQRAKLRDDRDRAIDDMARVKADVEQSKKQIASIEEEARKAGVPPGWLR